MDAYSEDLRQKIVEAVQQQRMTKSEAARTFGVSRCSVKSLSGNQYLGEDELGAGKMNETQVVLGLLFPTHQEPPKVFAFRRIWSWAS